MNCRISLDIHFGIYLAYLPNLISENYTFFHSHYSWEYQFSHHLFANNGILIFINLTDKWCFSIFSLFFIFVSNYQIFLKPRSLLSFKLCPVAYHPLLWQIFRYMLACVFPSLPVSLTSYHPFSYPS